MVLDPELTAAYLVVAAALALAPGPDVLFVIANGMRHRVKGAVAAAFGVVSGTLLHTVAAALGISALVAASPVAFEVLRYAGAAYLLYLGVQALRAACRSDATLKPGDGELSVLSVYRQGLITNLLNPKVIVFYLALLPQFVNVELGQVGLQMMLLGAIHNLMGMAVLLISGLAAGRAAAWLVKSNFARWLDAVAGVLFVGLALRLMIPDRPGP